MALEQATPKVSPARIPMTVLAAVLWLLGWLVGKAWSAIAWSCAAVKVGWMDARTPRPR